MNTKKPETLLQALRDQRAQHPAPVGPRHQALLRRLELIDAGCPPKMPGRYIR